MSPMYRKKPVVIEARVFDGSLASADHLQSWMRRGGTNAIIRHQEGKPNFVLYISTLEGLMLVAPHDYVIKGVKGEFYPCKPDIFAATYEEES